MEEKGKRKGKKDWRDGSGYEHLEYINEDLNSNPLHSCKKPGVVIDESPTPAPRKVEISDALGLAGHRPCSRFSERSCLT